MTFYHYTDPYGVHYYYCTNCKSKKKHELVTNTTEFTKPLWCSGCSVFLENKLTPSAILQLKESLLCGEGYNDTFSNQLRDFYGLQLKRCSSCSRFYDAQIVCGLSSCSRGVCLHCAPQCNCGNFRCRTHYVRCDTLIEGSTPLVRCAFRGCEGCDSQHRRDLDAHASRNTRRLMRCRNGNGQPPYDFLSDKDE